MTGATPEPVVDSEPLDQGRTQHIPLFPLFLSAVAHAIAIGGFAILEWSPHDRPRAEPPSPLLVDIVADDPDALPPGRKAAAAALPMEQLAAASGTDGADAIASVQAGATENPVDASQATVAAVPVDAGQEAVPAEGATAIPAAADPVEAAPALDPAAVEIAAAADTPPVPSVGIGASDRADTPPEPDAAQSGPPPEAEVAVAAPPSAASPADPATTLAPTDPPAEAAATSHPSIQRMIVDRPDNVASPPAGTPALAASGPERDAPALAAPAALAGDPAAVVLAGLPPAIDATAPAEAGRVPPASLSPPAVAAPAVLPGTSASSEASIQDAPAAAAAPGEPALNARPVENDQALSGIGGPAPAAIPATAGAVAPLAAPAPSPETGPSIDSVPAAVPDAPSPTIAATADRPQIALSTAMPADLPSATIDVAPTHSVPAADTLQQQVAAPDDSQPVDGGPALAAIVAPRRIDPHELDPDAQIEALLLRLSCAKIDAEFDPESGEVSLSGRLSSEADQKALVEQLNAMAGIRRVEASTLKILGKPYCEILDLLARPELARSDELRHDEASLGAAVEVQRLAVGDPLKLSFHAPDFASYVYVAYLSSDGTVGHLLPIGAYPGRKLEPDAQVDIGEGQEGAPAVRIRPPLGVDIVLALASSEPLFMEPRRQGERISDYLGALDAAIDRLRKQVSGVKFEYSYHPIEVVQGDR